MFDKRLAVLALCAMAGGAAAAPDEIQVYNDDINKPGEFGLELHANYVTKGDKEPAWPQQKPVYHQFRLTPEFSYGWSERLEFGLYLPMIRTNSGDYYLEGAKVRAKYLAADEENPFYWGINTELGRVSQRTEEYHVNLEVRPILGYKWGHFEFILNPILEWSLSDGASREANFSPALKVAYEFKKDLAVGIEHYAELGPLNHALPHSEQIHSTFLVLDGKVGKHDYQIGIGRGNSVSQDSWVIKGIVSFTF